MGTNLPIANTKNAACSDRSIMSSASGVADLLLCELGGVDAPHAVFTLPSGTKLVIPHKGPLRRSALALYKPYRMTGLAAKSLIWTGLWPGELVGVRRDALQTLRDLLARCLGKQHVECAFQFGATGIYSKTVILVMDSAGNALAYAKLAAGQIAQNALTYENSILRKFAAVSELRDRVPRMLAQTEWQGFPLSVISAGPPHLGPRSFNKMHLEYLARIKAATMTTCLFTDSPMWCRMQQWLCHWRNFLSADWQERYDWAFGELQTRLGQKRIELSLAHHDFVPWNIRQHRDGSLFVFDWEFSKEGSTPGWDMFHFHLAPQVAFNRNLDHNAIQGLIAAATRYGMEPAEDLLLAYLTDVALFHHDAVLNLSNDQHRFLTSVAQGIDVMRTLSVGKNVRAA